MIMKGRHEVAYSRWWRWVRHSNFSAALSARPAHGPISLSCRRRRWPRMALFRCWCPLVARATLRLAQWSKRQYLSTRWPLWYSGRNQRGNRIHVNSKVNVCRLQLQLFKNLELGLCGQKLASCGEEPFPCLIMASAAVEEIAERPRTPR